MFLKVSIRLFKFEWDFICIFKADEAYHIGPSPAVESYLRMEKIINVAKMSGAQVNEYQKEL